MRIPDITTNTDNSTSISGLEVFAQVRPSKMVHSAMPRQMHQGSQVAAKKDVKAVQQK